MRFGMRSVGPLLLVPVLAGCTGGEGGPPDGESDEGDPAASEPAAGLSPPPVEQRSGSSPACPEGVCARFEGRWDAVAVAPDGAAVLAGRYGLHLLRAGDGEAPLCARCDEGFFAADGRWAVGVPRDGEVEAREVRGDGRVSVPGGERVRAEPVNGGAAVLVTAAAGAWLLDLDEDARAVPLAGRLLGAGATPRIDRAGCRALLATAAGEVRLLDLRAGTGRNLDAAHAELHGGAAVTIGDDRILRIAGDGAPVALGSLAAGEPEVAAAGDVLLARVDDEGGAARRLVLHRRGRDTVRPLSRRALGIAGLAAGGRLAVWTESPPEPGRGTIAVASDLSTGRLRLLAAPRGFVRLAVEPGGRAVLVVERGEGEHRVRLWDPRRGEVRAVEGLAGTAADERLAVRFSPDGDRLALADDRRVVLVDVPTARVLRELPLPTSGPSLRFGAGDLLAILDEGRPEAPRLHALWTRDGTALPVGPGAAAPAVVAGRVLWTEAIDEAGFGRLVAADLAGARVETVAEVASIGPWRPELLAGVPRLLVAESPTLAEGERRSRLALLDRAGRRPLAEGVRSWAEAGDWLAVANGEALELRRLPSPEDEPIAREFRRATPPTR